MPLIGQAGSRDQSEALSCEDNADNIDDPQVETLALQKSHKASGQRTGLWAGAGT